MDQTFYIYLSVFFSVIGVVWFIFTFQTKVDDKKLITPYRGLTSCLFFALYMLYYKQTLDHSTGYVDAVLTTFLRTFLAMTGENSVFDTREALGVFPASWVSLLNVYTALLHVLLTILVIGFLFSLIRRSLKSFRYTLLTNKNICFFSEINERTVLLAEDFKKNKPEVVLVFIEKSERENPYNQEWNQRIENTNAFVFNEDIVSVLIPKGCMKNEINYFLLSDSETENLSLALSINDKYELKKDINMTISVGYNNLEAESLIDSIPRKNDSITFRLINEVQIMVDSLLDSMPVFLGCDNSDKEILILGMGHVGTQACKALSWCAHSLDYSPKIHVLDSKEDRLDCLLRSCPEFQSDEIEFSFHNIDVNSSQFSRFLEAHPNVGYVLCALGDEILNIQVAMEVRSIYAKINIAEYYNEISKPIINVLIHDPFMYDLGQELKFATRDDCKYKFNSFGSYAEIYTWENITGSYLINAGFAIHSYYCADGIPLDMVSPKEFEEYRLSFEKSEYNKHSSMAAALHIKYKIYSALKEMGVHKTFTSTDFQQHPNSCMQEIFKNYLLGLNENGELDNKLALDRIERLSMVEHRRWNAYTRSVGWSKSDREQVKEMVPYTKNFRHFLAKLHPCLVSWEDLDEVSKWLDDDYKIATDFKEVDRKLVRALPEVLKHIK